MTLTDIYAINTEATAAEIAEATETNLRIDLDDLRTLTANQFAIITGLQDRLSDESHRVASAEQCHRADVAMIGAALISEADDRQYCDEFDDVIDALNRRLTVPLPTRSRDFTVTGTVSVQCTVSARNEDEARASAENIMVEVSRTINGDTAASADDWTLDEVDED